ncbi:hypothetical protein [Kordiimonas sp.]|uniref:hypothetical protein n=1 Tax=Kordiimonas sp. TaxID=1970157 RepID=UPI003A8C8E09
MVEGDQNFDERAAPDELVGAVNLLMRSALNSGHEYLERLEGTGRKGVKVPTVEGKVSELLSWLAIDRSAHSKWTRGNGDISRSVNVTNKLLSLFQGHTYIERNDRNLRRDERDLAKFLHQYWIRTHKGLLTDTIKLLTDHLQTLSSIRQNERDQADEQLRQAVAVSAAQASFPVGLEERFRASSDYVVSPTPETLPPRLKPPREIVYREDDSRKLEELYQAHWNGGILIFLEGPPGAGKSALLQKFSHTISMKYMHGDTPAFLHVDFSDASRPLRAIFLALHGPRSLFDANLDDVDVDDESADTPHSPLNFEREFISSFISHTLGHHNLVAIFESLPKVTRDAALQELEAVLDLSVFRRATVLLEGNGAHPPVGLGRANVSVSLGPFTEPDAQAFLIGVGRQPETRAREAIEILREDKSLLYPGPLFQGAIRFGPAFEKTDEVITGENLALAVMEHAANLAESVLRVLCQEHGCALQPAMVTLMAIAILDSPNLTQDSLCGHELPTRLIEDLDRLNWLNIDNPFLLIGFGRDAIRARAALIFSSSLTRSSAEELRATIRDICSAFFCRRTQGTAAVLDRLVAWFEQFAPEETTLLSHFRILLAQEAAADPIAPSPEKQQQEDTSKYLRQSIDEADFDAALAALTLSTHGQFGAAADQFDGSLVSILKVVETIDHINSRQLSVLDTSLFYGLKKFHRIEAVLEARIRIASVIACQLESALGHHDEHWIQCWVSFILNMGELCLRQGDVSKGREHLELALQAFTRATWLPNTSWKQWLLARLAISSSHFMGTIAKERSELIRALEHAAQCVTLAPDDPRCIQFYLRTVRRLLEVEPDETLRTKWVDGAQNHLESIKGTPDTWNVGIRSQMAALIRNEARRAWNVRHQEKRIRSALCILQAGGVEDISSDPRACLVHARLLHTLGDDKKALSRSKRALELDPSPSAWHLKFRLMDSIANGAQNLPTDHINSLSEIYSLSDDLAEEMRRFRAWLEKAPINIRPYGRTYLWTIEREWRAEGSIERHIDQRLNAEGRNFVVLPKAQKLVLLADEFEKRQKKLNTIEKFFGDTVHLTLARFKNMAQFVRSKSVLTGEPSDVERPLKILNDALAHREGNQILLLQRARYHSYIWNTESAIQDFREVRMKSLNGEIRREAAANLAQQLYTSAVYRPSVETEESIEFLREAKSVVEDLSGSFYEAEDVAILGDQIALELDNSVDWVSVAKLHEKIVGTVEGFPNTLLENFDYFQNLTAGAPDNTAETLSTNFADPKVLGLVGGLYLRRAEKGLGNRILDDLNCAMGFFLAEALIERSWSGKEHPATSLNIGRTILAGAKHFHTLKPLPGLPSEGRADQLVLAVSKFGSAETRSTGAFRDIARMYQGETDMLRLALSRSSVDSSAQD